MEEFILAFACPCQSTSAVLALVEVFRVVAYCLPLIFFFSLSIIVEIQELKIVLNKTYQAVRVTGIILKMMWLFF